MLARASTIALAFATALGCAPSEPPRPASTPVALPLARSEGGDPSASDARGRSEHEASRRAGASCAAKQRCPPEEPICVLTDDGPRCVREASPEYDAVPGHRRFACTRQADCDGTDACLFTYGEHEIPARTYCGPHPGTQVPVVCDTVTDRCDPERDPACVPCLPAEPDVTRTLPWLGTW
ncbi:MAG: hypothetical protein IT373_25270 [Polyangiaceae bacterium]|nr:hypothetical protein [Polyangiaceae bacterium]